MSTLTVPFRSFSSFRFAFSVNKPSQHLRNYLIYVNLSLALYANLGTRIGDVFSSTGVLLLKV